MKYCIKRILVWAMLPFILSSESKATVFIHGFDGYGIPDYTINKRANSNCLIYSKDSILYIEPVPFEKVSMTSTKRKLSVGEVLNLNVAKGSAYDLNLTVSTVQNTSQWDGSSRGIKLGYHAAGTLRLEVYDAALPIVTLFENLESLGKGSFGLYLFRDTATSFRCGYDLGEGTDIIILNTTKLMKYANVKSLFVSIQTKYVGKRMVDSFGIKLISSVNIKSEKPIVEAKQVKSSSLKVKDKSSVIRGGSGLITLKTFDKVKWTEAGSVSTISVKKDHQYMVVYFTLKPGYSISASDYSLESKGKLYACESVSVADIFGPVATLTIADKSEKKVRMLFLAPRGLSSAKLIFNLPTVIPVSPINLILK